MHRVATLTAMALLFLLFPSHPAPAGVRAQCRFQGMDRGKWTDHEVKATIRCATDHYQVAGGTRKALCVARHESGFEATANNTRSTALGVYQVLVDTWSGWHGHLRSRWWHRGWELSHSRLNARANVIVSIRIAHAGGWGPWAETHHFC